jgi:orotidine-5'-phosphate decarboxylase
MEKAGSDYIDLARKKLIVALDLRSIEEARRLVDQLAGEVIFYKVGMGLQMVGGTDFAVELKETGKQVFLDYKYLDIEETIKSAVAQVAKANMDFLTVHGTGKIYQAAVEGRGNSSLKILCVTVLTSMDAQDVQELGLSCNVETLVLARAKKALDAGCDGVIASAREAAMIREMAGNKLVIVTPGIRPAGSPAGDQIRTANPGDAIRAGADYLVIGRPITQAPNPKDAAAAIVQEMAGALAG